MSDYPAVAFVDCVRELKAVIAAVDAGLHSPGPGPQLSVLGAEVDLLFVARQATGKSGRAGMEMALLTASHAEGTTIGRQWLQRMRVPLEVMPDRASSPEAVATATPLIDMVCQLRDCLAMAHHVGQANRNLAVGNPELEISFQIVQSSETTTGWLIRWLFFFGGENKQDTTHEWVHHLRLRLGVRDGATGGRVAVSRVRELPSRRDQSPTELTDE